jgi:hypothetical protein
MVGTRSLSSGARSRDPLALPTLRFAFVIASVATQSRAKQRLDCFVALLLAMMANHSTISATALPQAVVSALPPRSRVRSVRSPSVRSIAATIDAAAGFSPR